MEFKINDIVCVQGTGWLKEVKTTGRIVNVRTVKSLSTITQTLYSVETAKYGVIDCYENELQLIKYIVNDFVAVKNGVFSMFKRRVGRVTSYAPQEDYYLIDFGNGDRLWFRENELEECGEICFKDLPVGTKFTILSGLVYTKTSDVYGKINTTYEVGDEVEEMVTEPYTKVTPYKEVV